MPISEDKLINTLRDFFNEKRPGTGDAAEIITERVSRGGRIIAQITWPGFDQVGITQRQEMVWDYLKDKLQPDELLSISMIFTRGVAEGAVADAIEDTTRDLPWVK